MLERSLNTVELFEPSEDAQEFLQVFQGDDVSACGGCMPCSRSAMAIFPALVSLARALAFVSSLSLCLSLCLSRFLSRSASSLAHQLHHHSMTEYTFANVQKSL